jgi:hypothetical protein
VNLELTSEEKTVLRETVAGKVSELSFEIDETDNQEDKDSLRRRKVVLDSLLRVLTWAA